MSSRFILGYIFSQEKKIILVEKKLHKNQVNVENVPKFVQKIFPVLPIVSWEKFLKRFYAV